jgi:hypothetical protein
MSREAEEGLSAALTGSSCAQVEDAMELRADGARASADAAVVLRIGANRQVLNEQRGRGGAERGAKRLTMRTGGKRGGMARAALRARTRGANVPSDLRLNDF